MNVAGEKHPPADEPAAAAERLGPDQQTGAVESGKPGSGRPKLRWRKVLLVVVPVAILAVAGLALFRFADMDALLDGLTRPALVPARGQVLYQGQPLGSGQVVTEPVNGRGLSALGWTDDEGRFSLQTDIRGEYVDGATVGEHRVAVTVYQAIAGPAAPPLLTPQHYASVGSSPLRITISRNPDENEFKLALEGEPPSRATSPGKGKGKGKGKAKDKTEAAVDDEAAPIAKKKSDAEPDAREDAPDEQ